jgi:hypothetical protein
MNYFSHPRFPADLMENPEIYLGPNYKSVINFYELYDAGKIFTPGYNSIYYGSQYGDYKARLNHTVLEIVPSYIANKIHCYKAAYELIAMHLLLERGETLHYLPLLSYRK